MGRASASTRKSASAPLIWVILWVLSYFGARVVLKSMGPPAADWSRVGVALVPLVPFVLFLWTFINSVREADELERRIHLEALAFAYPMALLLIMVLALFQLAMPLNPEDWSYRHIWPFVWIFWMFGMAKARRRYQ